MIHDPEAVLTSGTPDSKTWFPTRFLVLSQWKQMLFSRVLAQYLPTAWNTQVPSHQLPSASVD